MHKLTIPGRYIFATGIAGLGILSFISKDFIVGRPPAWPEAFNVNPALGYISGAILLLACLAILANKKAATASMIIAILIFFLSVLRHLPHFMNDWLNAYKALALFGGALIVAASFLNEDHATATQGNKENLKKIFFVAGRLLLAVFFIAAGYAHFKFVDFIKGFIPAYIPFHVFWAYFCGVCLCAGGAGLIIPQTGKWAAFFSGVMVLGWFILLHIPRFFADTTNVSDRMGLCESFAFAGIFFVMAGMLSRRPS